MLGTCRGPDNPARVGGPVVGAIFDQVDAAMGISNFTPARNMRTPVARENSRSENERCQ